MKNFLLSLVIMFAAINICNAQANSIQELGEIVTVALESGNLDIFKSGIMSKADFLAKMKENAPPGIPPEQMDAAITDMYNTYDKNILEPYITDFTATYDKIKILKLDFRKVQFQTLKTSSQMDPGVKLVHGNIDHPIYKHVYFFAKEENKIWYMAAPMVKVTEDNLDF